MKTRERAAVSRLDCACFPGEVHDAGDATYSATLRSAFHCIGTECEDSCCHGMSVLVDKKTYEKYQAFPEERLGSLVQQYVSINMMGATDSLYARISPNSSNRCPFLSEERLCGVQKEYGSEYLSATCSTYPRALNSVEDELEVSLYLSCPQATRQILLDANSTQSVGDATSGRFRADQFSRLATMGSGSLYKPLRYFWEIRELVVAMIQDRGRPLWQRLFLLGILCRRLGEITSAEQDEAVPEILRSYREIVATGALRDKMERIPAQPAVQLDVVLRLVDQRIRAGSCGERFLECFEAFLGASAIRRGRLRRAMRNTTSKQRRGTAGLSSRAIRMCSKTIC